MCLLVTTFWEINLQTIWWVRNPSKLLHMWLLHAHHRSPWTKLTASYHNTKLLCGVFALGWGSRPRKMAKIWIHVFKDNRMSLQPPFLACIISPHYKTLKLFLSSVSATKTFLSHWDPAFPAIAPLEDHYLCTIMLCIQLTSCI